MKPEEVAEFTRLLEAATPGPWEISGPHSRIRKEDEGPGEKWIEDGYTIHGPNVYGNYECGYMTKDTAEFVCFLRNHAGDFLAALSDAQEVEQTRVLLDHFREREAELVAALRGPQLPESLAKPSGVDAAKALDQLLCEGEAPQGGTPCP